VNNTIDIYTDGSCNPQKVTGGWAAVILEKDKEIILKGTEISKSHNAMELLAVIKALEYIAEHNLNHGEITVYSDSQYVVNIIDRKQKLIEKDFKTKKGADRKNSDLVKKLIHYIEILHPRFIKVKAHQKKNAKGNYNRNVDKLSRKIVRDNIC